LVPENDEMSRVFLSCDSDLLSIMTAVSISQILKDSEVAVVVVVVVVGHS
jgi:hypothetical protein